MRFRHKNPFFPWRNASVMKPFPGQKGKERPSPLSHPPLFRSSVRNHDFMRIAVGSSELAQCQVNYVQRFALVRARHA